MPGCMFPYTGEDCSLTLAQVNSGYYNASRTAALSAVTFGVVLGLYSQYRLFVTNRADLSRMDQKLVLIELLAMCFIFPRALDPSGWNGLISPMLFIALQLMVCSCSTMMTYYAYISIKFILKHVYCTQSNETRYLHYFVNFKNLLDIIGFVIILNVEDSFSYVYGSFAIYSAIFYSVLNYLTLTKCNQLCKLIESLSGNMSIPAKKIALYKSATGRISTYVRLVWLLVPPCILLSFCIGAFYLYYGYDMHDAYYRNPQEIDNTWLRLLYCLFIDSFTLITLHFPLAVLSLVNHIFPRIFYFEKDMITDGLAISELSQRRVPVISRLLNRFSSRSRSIMESNDSAMSAIA